MSFRTKLLFAYIAIAVLPLAVFMAISYVVTRDTLLAQETAMLEAIADAKVASIKSYIENFREEVAVAQDDYNIKKNFSVLAAHASDRNNPQFLAAKGQLDDQYGQWAVKRDDIVDLMLVGVDGRILYASNPSHQSEDVGSLLPDDNGETFKNGREGIYISDLFVDKVNEGKPGLLAAGPVTDFSGAFVGLVVFEIDAQELFALIQDTTGLGETGETQIAQLFSREGEGKSPTPDSVAHNGDRVVFLNPLRFDANAAFVREEIFGTHAPKPAQLAVSGKSGEGISTDYRNEKVLAAWRYIPSRNWGLVAKIDYREVIAPANALLVGYFLTTILFFILVVMISWILSGINSRAVSITEEEKKKLEVIIQSIGDGVFVVDRDLNILLLNEVAAKLAGYTERESLVGRPYSEVLNFIHEDTGLVNDDFVTQAIASGTVQKMSNHTAIVRKDGSRTPVLDSASPLKNERGEILGVVVVFRDASEERRVEVAQREATERADEADRLNRIAIDRELRMIELKEEIELLKKA